MFFSGDSSARKRVDLGGRSSKERDRQKLLEQTRLERNRRLWLRQQNSAAIKIQKCFRGRKAVEAERLRVREHFFMTYGKRCQNVDRHSFGLDSDFLRQLLFFFNPQNVADFSALVETCRLLQQFVRESAGGILSLFAGVDYSSKYAVVDYRVKQLAYACIRGVHQNRNQLKDQLFMTSDKSSTSTILLLEAVVMLIDPGLPWSCKIVGYLLQRNTYYLLREIVLTGKESIKFQDSVGKISSLEGILALIIPHVGQRSCVCANIDPRWSFSSQILTIPFLWKLFPYLKEIFATRGLSVHYIHQMALCVQNHANVLPNDIATEFPGYACLLGNLLETAGVAFSQPDCSFDMAIDFAAVATFLLEALPPMQSSNKESKEVDEDEIIVGDEMMEKGLNKDLELQISNAIDPRFLLQLTNVLFGRISFVNGSYEEGAHGKEVVAVGAACAFLHVTFNILPLERVMTVLAYRTELVPVIWKFMKRCHENQMWSALSGQLSYLPGDAPGWLLPLSVFCPVYKHMLMIVDNEEFYEQEKPLSIKDMKCLVVILRQALWQLLWVNPVTPPNPAKCAADVFTLKRHPLEFIQHRVSIVASDLLSQVFAYGILTLEQFLDRLVDLPLLCNHILQISHLHGTHVELIAFIEHTLARISSSHLISNGGSSSFTDPHIGSIPTTVEMVELVGPRSLQHGKQLSSSLPVQQIHQGLLGDRHKAHSTSGIFSKPISPPRNSSNVSLSDIPNPQKNATGVPAAVLSSSSGFLHSSRAITSSMQHSSTTGFGSALNIETLVAAAERRDTSIEVFFCLLLKEFSPDGRFIISADRDFKIRVTLFPKKPLDGTHEIQCFCLGHSNADPRGNAEPKGG